MVKTIKSQKRPSKLGVAVARAREVTAEAPRFPLQAPWLFSWRGT